eukprot:PITA_28841
MTSNPHSDKRHGYIIAVVDYFTNWAKVIPTFNNTDETTAYFLFNKVISRFGVPKAIVTDHEKHFQNHMMTELAETLGLSHENSTPYYPQANERLRAATGFAPFQLVYGMEEIFSTECKIPSLKLAIKLLPSTLVNEEHLLHLTRLDEIWHNVALANEAHKICIKAQYDKSVKLESSRKDI